MRLFYARETPLDTARRERAEHLECCDRCAGGLDCSTADDLDRRLTALAEADVPWGTSFPNGNNCKENDNA